jgi:hypothetical protein
LKNTQRKADLTIKRKITRKIILFLLVILCIDSLNLQNICEAMLETRYPNEGKA